MDYKKKHGFGGILKKALPIAAAGAAFIPGVGPAAAMGINAAAGAISNSIPEEERQMKQKQSRQYAASSYGYAKGGAVNSKADGGMVEFYGPTHGQGGIDIGNGNEVEHGETMDFVMKKGGVYKGKQPYVFSNRVNVPGKNMSFARYHKTLAKGGASDQQILDLAMQQEKVTGRFNRPKTGNNMAKGGAVKKYAFGKSLDISGPGYPDRSITDIATDVSGWWDNPSNRSMAYSMIPDAINVATGAFSKDKTPKPTQVNRGSLRHLRNMPTSYNINPILTQNAASYRSILADPGTNDASKLAAHSQKLQADSAAYGEKANRETQMKSQKQRSLASASGRLDTIQSRYDAQARDDRMRTDANTGIGGNIARQGLAGISNKLAMRSAEQSLADQDSEQMETLAKLLLNDPQLLQRVLGKIQ